jgi:hypothetical protein
MFLALILTQSILCVRLYTNGTNWPAEPATFITIHNVILL